MDGDSQQAEGYNYRRFGPRVLGEDYRLLQHPAGPLLGELAPDFLLEDVDGHRWRLSDLRGLPVVLIFGSASCPLTAGSLPGLRELHRECYDQLQWLFVYVREAHPGEQLDSHHSFEQKREAARRLREEERIAWPLLVDRLEGQVHAAYGGLPNAVFLIDRGGRVAFRGEMAHAPTLRDAILRLRQRHGRGPLPDGRDRGLHMLGPLTYGWRALRRAGRRARWDTVRRAPPLALNLWLGYQLRSLLGPIARRSRHLPLGTRVVLAAGMIAGVLALLGRTLRRRDLRP